MEQPDTTPVEETEETPAAEAETTAPPWGDDFDPQKAWDTIQAQRASEKELKEQAQRASEKWEQEEAHLEWMRAHGFEIADDEDEDPDLYEDDEGQPEVDPDVAWLKQRETDRMYREDLEEALPEGVKYRDLSEADRVYIQHKTTEGGANKAALGKAVKAWEQWRKDSETEAIERYRESKKTPHVSKVGTAATDDSNRLDIDDDAERHRRMAERLRLAKQQQ